MVDNAQSKYGFGKNPPYSLYQAPDGKWGLIDGFGQKLEADFKRRNGNCFSCVPWEVVCFDPQEGFELQAWFDPDEVWFKFTFNDKDYPPEFGHYLWKRGERTLEEVTDVILSLLAPDSHWLMEGMLLVAKEDDMEDEEFDEALRNKLSQYPLLKQPSKLNPLLDPIMRNPDVDDEIKHILWRSKVNLDYSIKTLLSEE